MIPMQKEMHALLNEGRKRGKAPDKTPVEKRRPTGMGQFDIQIRSEKANEHAAQGIDENHFPGEMVAPNALQRRCGQIPAHGAQGTPQTNADQQKKIRFHGSSSSMLLPSNNRLLRTLSAAALI